MNAFATGRNKDRAVVAVTRGLLEKLTPEEISGVVGHELSHIENGDMFLMSVLSILAGFISILADSFWRGSLMGRSDRDRSGVIALIGLALAILAPITAYHVQENIWQMLKGHKFAVTLCILHPHSTKLKMTAFRYREQDKRPRIYIFQIRLKGISYQI